MSFAYAANFVPASICSWNSNQSLRIPGARPVPDRSDILQIVWLRVQELQTKQLAAASARGWVGDRLLSKALTIEETVVPEAIELLKTRRSMKPLEMTGPGPSPSELNTILTVGARVPDHGRLTPWRFIVFESDARSRAGDVIANVFARKNPAATTVEIDVEKSRFTHTPLVIGVVSFTKPHPKVPAWEQELSAGASAMNIISAATALGYGTCWLTGWFSYDRDVLDGFGLKSSEKLAGLIYIGTPTRPSEDRSRPALSDIVTRF
jgi:nitroreductase